MSKHAYLVRKYATAHGAAAVLLGLSIFIVMHYPFSSWDFLHSFIACLFILAYAGSTLLCYVGYHKRMLKFVISEQLRQLQNMHWRKFEDQIVQAFMYRGYVIERSNNTNIDNGLDFIARRQAVTILVQCRHWQKRQIEVKEVRASYNLMKYHQASAVKMVACSDYSNDAWKFVVGKPFELIHGEALLALLNLTQWPLDKNVVPFHVPVTPPPMHHRPRTAAHT